MSAIGGALGTVAMGQVLAAMSGSAAAPRAAMTWSWVVTAYLKKMTDDTMSLCMNL